MTDSAKIKADNPTPTKLVLMIHLTATAQAVAKSLGKHSRLHLQEKCSADVLKERPWSPAEQCVTVL
jgi:hypothetical protein